MNLLRRSYLLCQKITRKKARNFFYAFLLLPKSRRKAIYTIYAFMRHSDDIVDNARSVAEKQSELHAWRKLVKAAFAGQAVQHPILPAFMDTVRHYDIPRQYFFDLLDGMEMDLKKYRYETFDELYQYCYRVASVVGLVCIHIFRFNDKKALEYAEKAGIAFQITNILRDIREDCGNHRIYIPQEDLIKFRYSEEKLRQGVVDDHFRRLLHYQIERARDFYQKAELLIPYIDPTCRKALSALIGIYYGLLEKISVEDEMVFEKQIRLSLFEKMGIVFKAWRQTQAVLVTP